MLEACGVGRVTGDRYVYAFLPHDGYALTYIVGTVAVNLCTGTVRVSDALDLLEFACVVVKLGLHVGETVDACDDLCSVLTQTVEDYAEGLLTYLVGLGSDLDSTLSSSE